MSDPAPAESLTRPTINVDAAEAAKSSGTVQTSPDEADEINLGDDAPSVLTATTFASPRSGESSSIPPPSPSIAAESTFSTASPMSSALKSRSNSTLLSSRPAPASPISSRPTSQIFGSSLLTPNSPSPSRDRAPSTSSSRVRRVSNSSHPSRASSKPRPKSLLGGPSVNAGDEPDSGTVTPVAGERSAAATPIDTALATLPEDIVPSRKFREEERIVVRDFAFPASDPRFHGPGLPLAVEDDDEPASRGSEWGESSDSAVSIATTSSRKTSGWGGFGLLSSWSGLLGRRRGSTSAESNNDEDDYRLETNVQPDHYQDDYAFSESESASEEEEAGEPWGFYRAAYAFEAMGEHEIGMEEGDLVEVRGRGGGEGWVVAVKRRMDGHGRVVRLDEAEDGEGREGLVPESYLEKAGDMELAPPSDRPRVSDEPATSPILEERELNPPTDLDASKLTEEVEEKPIQGLQPAAEVHGT